MSLNDNNFEINTLSTLTKTKTFYNKLYTQER